MANSPFSFIRAFFVFFFLGALTKSQFPVFTIYAQKTRCLKQKPCERAWCIDRVQGYALRNHVKRSSTAVSRQDCYEKCFSETDFLCRWVSISVVLSCFMCCNDVAGIFGNIFLDFLEKWNFWAFKLTFLNFFETLIFGTNFLNKWNFETFFFNLKKKMNFWVLKLATLISFWIFWIFHF